MNKQNYTIAAGDPDMNIEFNDLAVHADGSVTVSMGDTVVMAVAVLGGEKNYPDGGLALRVDYEERNYARGAILGGKFNKREGKPTDEATLTARVVDRTIRPFFPKHFNREVQVVCTVLSLGEYDPDVLAVNAACLALQTSNIPWDGPVGCVRVSQNQEESEVVVNPTYAERHTEHNYYNAIVAGTGDKIAMIEVEGSEVSNEDMVTGCEIAMTQLAALTDLYETINREQGREKIAWELTEYSETLEQVFDAKFRHVIEASLNKVLDNEVVSFWKKDFRREVQLTDETNRENTDMYVEHQIKHIVRDSITKHGERMDGRGLEDVRSLYAQAGGVTGRQHGTGIFYRGDTRVLSVLTLGSLEDDSLLHHEMEIDGPQRWMHHYNFPSYSVGEVGRMGSPGRREIGHGTLAQKGIVRMLPPEEEFPYAIRVVSEVMSSNGSTSMASTCAACLALMDGGVPIKKPVGGIACGLVTDGGDYTILTDILGREDFYGDMDFKVTGTRDGITAIQLDCKIHGLSIDIIRETLDRSNAARMMVLDAMENEIKEPRALTDQVERIITVKIPQDKIGLVIGKGGVTIKKITADSGARVDIKRDGTAVITGNGDVGDKARDMIEQILKHSD